MITRQQLIDGIRASIIQGIQRNGDRIYDTSQSTDKCFVPVDKGFLKHSGVKDDLPAGMRIAYRAPYACIPFKYPQDIALPDGKKIRVNKLNPGIIVDNGFGKSVEIIAIKKQRIQGRLLKITTETGKNIIVTDNHYVMNGDGDFIESKNLTVGDTLSSDDRWTDERQIECTICHQYMRALSHTHLKKHNISMKEYKRYYGNLRIGTRNNSLPAWNKDLTKYDDIRIAKYAETLKIYTSFKKESTKQKMRENHWSTKREHSFNYKIENHSNVCRICEQQSDSRVFCSPVCETFWRTIRYSGEGNPRFGKPFWHTQETKQKMIGRPNLNPHGHGKHGFREDIKHFVRSSWEANFARLLQYMNVPYIYEGKRFMLQDKSYLPDFYIIPTDTYVEIKGWDRDGHMKEIERQMSERYPDVKLLTIGDKQYKILNKMHKMKVPNWE